MKPLLKLPFGLGIYRRADVNNAVYLCAAHEDDLFWKDVAEDRQRRLDKQAFKLGDISAYISGVSSRRVSKKKIEQILRGE